MYIYTYICDLRMILTCGSSDGLQLSDGLGISAGL